jgi:hypothetical protein
VQRIVLPVVTDLVTGSELGDQGCRRLARLVEREGVNAMNNDMRHMRFVPEVTRGLGRQLGQHPRQMQIPTARVALGANPDDVQVIPAGPDAWAVPDSGLR